MIKLPVGWCGVLTSLEHELHDHRVHDAADPEHFACEGGAAGCAAIRRETDARYHAALRMCTGAERRAAQRQAL